MGAAGKPAAPFLFFLDRIRHNTVDYERLNGMHLITSRTDQHLWKCHLPILLLLLFGINVNSQTVLPGDSIDLGMGGNNTITGTVFNSVGKRIETRVSIRLATMTRGDVITVTNEKGVFYFRGLPAGNYTVIIDKEKDFEVFTQDVNIIQFRGSPPQVQTLSIRLIPKAKPEMVTAVIDSDLVNVPPKAIEHYDKAVIFSRERKHDSAIEQLQLSINEYPDFMLAYNELGVQYLHLSDLNKADESLKKALELKPAAYMPLVNRGIVLFTMKRYAEAEPVLLSALKQDETSLVVRFFLGQTFANLGRFDEAERELVKAIAAGDEEMKEAHRILAIIYSSRGDKQNAAHHLEAYLRLNPDAKDADQLRQVLRNLKGT